MKRKIAQLLFLVLFFTITPLSFILADNYELKVYPKIIYEGEQVSVNAVAEYNVLGGCTSLSFGGVISSPPSVNCNSIIRYGDGAQDNLRCYGPLLVQACDDQFPFYSIWECSCQLETTHIYQNAQPDPYIIQLSGASGGLAAQEEVKVMARPTITPTASANPLRSTSIADIIHQAGNAMFIIGAAGTLLMLLIGGYYLMFAHGNPSLVTKGKRIILISFIGFAMLVLARGIVYFVENIFRQ